MGAVRTRPRAVPSSRPSRSPTFDVLSASVLLAWRAAPVVLVVSALVWAGYATFGAFALLVTALPFSASWMHQNRRLSAVSARRMTAYLKDARPASASLCDTAAILAGRADVVLLGVVVADDLVGEDNAAWWPSADRCGYVVVGSTFESDGTHAHAVLAHELGHGALRHRTSTGLGLFGPVCAVSTAVVLLMSPTFVNFVVAVFMFAAAYSAAQVASAHRRELAADAFAVSLVGLDNYAALLGSLPTRSADVTHPSPGVRLSALGSGRVLQWRTHRVVSPRRNLSAKRPPATTAVVGSPVVAN